MTGSLQPELLAAGAALAAIALVTGGAAIRWFRMHDDSAASLSRLAITGRIVTMAVVTVVAATLIRMAVGLLVAEEGATTNWLWLIRTESVAIAGSFSLILFLDSNSGRIQLLLGAGLAGGATWALGEWVEFLHVSAELDGLCGPLMA